MIWDNVGKNLIFSEVSTSQGIPAKLPKSLLGQTGLSFEFPWFEWWWICLLSYKNKKSYPPPPPPPQKKKKQKNTRGNVQWDKKNICYVKITAKPEVNTRCPIVPSPTADHQPLSCPVRLSVGRPPPPTPLLLPAASSHTDRQTGRGLSFSHWYTHKQGRGSQRHREGFPRTQRGEGFPRTQGGIPQDTHREGFPRTQRGEGFSRTQGGIPQDTGRGGVPQDTAKRGIPQDTEKGVVPR